MKLENAWTLLMAHVDDSGELVAKFLVGNAQLVRRLAVVVEGEVGAEEVAAELADERVAAPRQVRRVGRDQVVARRALLPLPPGQQEHLSIQAGHLLISL